MKNIQKTENEYTKLRNDLEAIISSGRASLEKAATEIAVRTHWEAGKRLNEWIEKVETESVAGIIETLARDLNLHSSVLYRSSKFFRTYPDGLPDTVEFKSLSWGAHTELLPIADEDERLFYIRRAAEKNWTRNYLKKAIRANEYGAKNSSRKKDSVRLQKPGPGLYTYEAELERVVDGDTIIVRIDLGFDVLSRQRIRLSYVDAPDVKTPEGEKARRFVKKALKNTGRLVLKTRKVDKYGRYVADVMYHSEAISKDHVLESGKFLNQELLDRGLAGFVG